MLGLQLHFLLLSSKVSSPASSVLNSRASLKLFLPAHQGTLTNLTLKIFSGIPSLKMTEKKLLYLLLLLKIVRKQLSLIGGLFKELKDIQTCLSKKMDFFGYWNSKTKIHSFPASNVI